MVLAKPLLEHAEQLVSGFYACSLSVGVFAHEFNIYFTALFLS